MLVKEATGGFAHNFQDYLTGTEESLTIVSGVILTNIDRQNKHMDTMVNIKKHKTYHKFTWCVSH